jgi:hypothetical protein
VTLAAVELHTGRWCLMIAGLVIAVEGDPNREWAFDGKKWTKETLEQAATRINSVVASMREAEL